MLQTIALYFSMGVLLSLGLVLVSGSFLPVCLVYPLLLAYLQPPLYLANLVTQARGLFPTICLALCSTGILRAPPAGSISVLAILTMALDFLDGYIARHIQSQGCTLMGKFLDINTDGFCVLLLSLWNA